MLGRPSALRRVTLRGCPSPRCFLQAGELSPGALRRSRCNAAVLVPARLSSLYKMLARPCCCASSRSATGLRRAPRRRPVKFLLGASRKSRWNEPRPEVHTVRLRLMLADLRGRSPCVALRHARRWPFRARSRRPVSSCRAPCASPVSMRRAQFLHTLELHQHARWPVLRWAASRSTETLPCPSRSVQSVLPAHLQVPRWAAVCASALWRSRLSLMFSRASAASPHARWRVWLIYSPAAAQPLTQALDLSPCAASVGIAYHPISAWWSKSSALRLPASADSFAMVFAQARPAPPAGALQFLLGRGVHLLRLCPVRPVAPPAFAAPPHAACVAAMFNCAVQSRCFFLVAAQFQHVLPDASASSPLQRSRHSPLLQRREIGRRALRMLPRSASQVPLPFRCGEFANPSIRFPPCRHGFEDCPVARWPPPVDSANRWCDQLTRWTEFQPAPRRVVLPQLRPFLALRRPAGGSLSTLCPGPRLPPPAPSRGRPTLVKACPVPPAPRSVLPGSFPSRS